MLMKKILVKINFPWDDNDDVKEFQLIVPHNISETVVSEALEEAHVFLDTDDVEDRYGNAGRTPETLMQYVCEQHNWKWEELEFGIDLVLN